MCVAVEAIGPKHLTALRVNQSRLNTHAVTYAAGTPLHDVSGSDAARHLVGLCWLSLESLYGAAR